MKRIILVEDDEPIRDAFQMIFEGSNCEVINFENGDKVLSGEIDAPDLFILDKQISGTNGLDICRFIKASEKFKNIPVIMLSANPQIKTLAKDAGADYAISKPFSIKTLREVVATYVKL